MSETSISDADVLDAVTIRDDDILSLETVIEKFPQYGNERRWRWMIFNRMSYGLDDVVKKFGGRWYVIMPRLRRAVLRGDVA